MSSSSSSTLASDHAQHTHELRPPTCFVCQASCHIRPIDEHILVGYQMRICIVCQSKSKSSWKEITTTQAKTRYLVSDNVLKQLPFVEKANPRNSHFRPMKLYLTYQVEEAALAIWETLDNIDREIVHRAKRKQAKKEKNGQRKRLKKTLVRPKKTSALEAPERSVLDLSSSSSSSASSVFQLAPTGKFATNGTIDGVGPMKFAGLSKAHVHQFGPLMENKDDGEHYKICKSCGFTKDVELM